MPSPRPPRTSPSPPRLTGDLRDLAADLAREVAGEVRFDAQARAAWSTDASNYRQVPLGVVMPRNADDVEAALAVCRRFGAPVLGRGGGTSLAGQATNTAVVLDFSRHLGRVLEVDRERRLARVEPGAVLDRLQEAARPHGLVFGPDPSTHASCTLGGMIGNNACGVHSLTAGRTSDNVESLEVVTWGGERFSLGAVPEAELAAAEAAGGPRGEILGRLRDLGERWAPLVRRRFPRIPRRVSGYNLDDLLPGPGFHPARALVGSEGTCVTVLEATVRLVPRPSERALVVAAWPTLAAAAAAVPEALAAGAEALIGLEGLDRHLIDNAYIRRFLPQAPELFPDGDGCLLAELGSFADEGAGAAAAAARRLAAALERSGGATGVRILTDARARALAWKVREVGLGATAHHPELGDTGPGWEDSAVAPERLGAYVRDLQDLLSRFAYPSALYGHFGDGCLHARIGFDLASPEGARRFRGFVEEAADLVVAHGGSLSGEHGDGQARGELLPRMFGPELIEAFREFKGVWDPEGRMNPGKVVDPRPLDADLRQLPGTLGEVPQEMPGTSPGLAARFAYPEDGGSFERAVARCVGVGKCRRQVGGTMCPSFRVTDQEEHSTRGRARLLGEMLRGEVLAGGFHNREVRDALDLCLACKGCKSDCPAGVDMATYKAEFLARHYRRKPRPRGAYTLGLVTWWARLASRMPNLCNTVAESSLGGKLLRAAAGIHPERRLPHLAPQTLRSWFETREPPRRSRPGRPVLLWPDTFTDLFAPEIGRAAVEVLEAAGCEVSLPRRILCCGRPLYDHGMLKLARRQLRRTLDVLIPEIAAEVPVVGLEPSCIAVFRDELPNLFPDAPEAQALSAHAFLLGEFLHREAPDLELRRLGGRALFHGHCHQKSVLEMEGDRQLLARLGLDFEEPETGCCGMAGAFGFERRHWEVSMACAERALLPAVRQAGDGALLVADGFSCREQIAQATGRRPLHLAQVLRRGLE